MQCHDSRVPTSLTFSEHLAALESSGTRLAELAVEAGMDAPVPTCPTWEVDALVAHQAMVHRWATAHVRGDDLDSVPDQTEIRTTVDDLVGYYRQGHAALLDAFGAAEPDLTAMTFLNDCPAPREFWARRQAHETTIHMVDALAARCGTLPTAAEAGIPKPLAVDGIDELLRGFLTRGRSKLYDGDEYAIAVTPTDTEQNWVVIVAERLTVEPDGAAAAGDAAAATITGTAAQLYLTLWNRGDEAHGTGQPDVLDRWRVAHRVRW
jgi:uncharacterized protein (TIGR03083 family)